MKEVVSNNKKIVIGIFGVVMMILLFFGMSYAYLNFNLFGVKKNTIVVGNLTVLLDESTTEGINLDNAYPVNEANGMKNPSYTFKITNNKTPANYVLKLINDEKEITTTPDSAIRYYLKKNNEETIKLLSEATNRILDSGILQKGETNSYELKLWIDYNAGNEVQGTSFNSKIKVEVNQETPKQTLAEAVIANLGNTGTTYKAEDGSTYIRGEANKVNNYVWYSGMMWRIYRINSGGSVKVIMDDNASIISFHQTSNVYETSYMKDWLNTYFWERLNTSKTTVLKQDNEFCIDSTDLNTSAREECTNKLTNQKIGLLTLDEYNIVKNGSNNNYLNNKLNHLTMTPNATDTNYEWFINIDGNSLWDGYVSNVYGVRTVVSFDSITTITFGNGSQTSPYKVMNDVAKATSGTKLNTRYSGELITYDNKLFRIMEISNNLTKVVYDGAPVITPNGEFGTNNLDWGTMKIRLESSGIDTSKIALNQTWQRGYFVGGNNVLTTSLGNGNAVEATFGLTRVGEMWASLNNIKTINYTKFSTQIYWTMTPYKMNAANEWFVYFDGGSNIIDVSNEFTARPVFFFKEDITIAGGNGTPNSPYTLN